MAEHDTPRSSLDSQSSKEGQPPEDATVAGEAEVRGSGHQGLRPLWDTQYAAGLHPVPVSGTDLIQGIPELASQPGSCAPGLQRRLQGKEAASVCSKRQSAARLRSTAAHAASPAAGQDRKVCPHMLKQPLLSHHSTSLPAPACLCKAQSGTPSPHHLQASPATGSSQSTHVQAGQSSPPPFQAPRPSRRRKKNGLPRNNTTAMPPAALQPRNTGPGPLQAPCVLPWCRTRGKSSCRCTTTPTRSRPALPPGSWAPTRSPARLGAGSRSRLRSSATSSTGARIPWLLKMRHSWKMESCAHLCALGWGPSASRGVYSL